MTDDKVKRDNQMNKHQAQVSISVELVSMLLCYNYDCRRIQLHHQWRCQSPALLLTKPNSTMHIIQHPITYNIHQSRDNVHTILSVNDACENAALLRKTIMFSHLRRPSPSCTRLPPEALLSARGRPGPVLRAVPRPAEGLPPGARGAAA